MIDLNRFVCTDGIKEKLSKPFSRGEFSYASECHIGVRVPRREDIPENPDAPDLEKIIQDAKRIEGRTWHDLPEYHWQEPKPCNSWCKGTGYIKACEECEGSGTTQCGECGSEIECEACQGGDPTSCEKDAEDAKPCEDCGGTGKEAQWGHGDIFINGKPFVRFGAQFLDMIKDLPNIKIGIDPKNPLGPALLKFDGGDGVLMPMRIW